MKIIKLSTACLLISGFSITTAQVQEPKTVKRIKISSIIIQPGFFVERNPSGAISDFNALAPNSVLLAKSKALALSSSNNGVTLGGNNMFTILLGIDFRDKQKTTYKTNPHLRVGLSYFSGTSISSGIYNENRKRYDTLSSSNTGHSVYLDSVTSTNYGMNYSYEQLRIDASLIFRTNPEARWSLYSGIGITAGVSINAYTNISYSKSKMTEVVNPNGNSSSTYSSNYNDEYKSEKFMNKNNFGLSTYIPLGIDFRLGKKREFWKRTHLFYEVRPSINITSIPELRTITNAALQHGLGLKVSW